MNRPIGTCSICGGVVSVFAGAWGGTEPPKPSCEQCRATPALTGPVIQMIAPVRPHPADLTDIQRAALGWMGYPTD